MDYKKKQDSQARILYIVLAALLVTVMIVSVITAVNKRNKRPQAPLDTGTEGTETVAQTRAPVTKVEPQTMPPQQTQEPETNVPAQTEEDTQVSQIGGGDEQVSNRVYVVPAEGQVMKDFSIDMPVYSLTMDDYRAHKGIDISVEYGSPVYSFTDGTIEQIYDDPMMGTSIVINHGDGLQSCYRNLQVEFPDGIAVGAKVKAGDVIGAVGDTTLVELAEVSHLHFEILEAGEYVNPSEYLPVLSSNTEE